MHYQMNEFLFAMILTELEDAVGKENCSTRTIDKVTHSVDYYWLSRMWADRGCRMPEADFVVCPENAEQVSKVVKIANYYKIPVTTWGAGGGTQGGAIPVCGGIILDTKRMNKIYEVNTEGMYIECGTGAIYKHIEWAANEVGKATMHYPSSLTCSTVGGFLAHRGIGVVSTKYGKIDDMVLKMEVVLPNGDIIETSSAPKHAAGPDLNQIFIGSEGTLGVITKAQIRIFDQPEERRFRAFLFQDMSGAFKASRELLQKFKPSVMRLYDEAETASLIKKIVGVERKGAFMNIAYEGDREMVEVEEKILLKTFAKYGAEDLAGQPAVFKVKLHEIKIKELPEVTPPEGKVLVTWVTQKYEAVRPGIEINEDTTFNSFSKVISGLNDKRYSFEYLFLFKPEFALSNGLNVIYL